MEFSPRWASASGYRVGGGRSGSDRSEEVSEKFHATAERRLPPEQAARFAELTLSLETLHGVDQLIDASIAPTAHRVSG